MRLNYILVVIFLAISHHHHGEAAKILGVFHVPSPSHVILAQNLFKALAAKGHEVTVITAHPLNIPNKNYREIFLEEMIEFKAKTMAPMLNPNASFYTKCTSMLTMPSQMCEIFLSNKDVQNLKSEHFDVVIQNIMLSEPLLGLAHHFNAPVIGFGTVGSNVLTNQFVGNPNPLSYVPIMGTALPTTGMNFFERILNTMGAFLGVLLFRAQDYYSNAVYRKHFPDGPCLHELKTNVSLVFVNSHYSIESPRPYVPNMIPIGGIHIEEPKKLPRDLQEYLDSAKDGSIFFSFGSNFQLLNLGQDKVKAIMDTLGSLKMKILFKSDEELQDVPSNIKIAEWLPQNDILAHPNVKLFISHGGLLSTTEAVYHGVPILGVPLFGDQEQNVMVSVADGYAVQVKPADLTKETFSNALDEILNNPKYRQNIKLRSSLLREQPIKPLDLAVFWVEHVLKHKGAAHLKNIGVTLPWYQYHLIDVLAFIALAVSLVTYLGFVILRKIVRCVLKKKCTSATKTKAQSKKKTN